MCAVVVFCFPHGCCLCECRAKALVPCVEVFAPQTQAAMCLLFNQQTDMCACRPEALGPFVELCFQGALQRTHTAEGCAPLWNEHFVLPYQPASGELGPSMLEEVRAR